MQAVMTIERKTWGDTGNIRKFDPKGKTEFFQRGSLNYRTKIAQEMDRVQHPLNTKAKKSFADTIGQQVEAGLDGADARDPNIIRFAVRMIEIALEDAETFWKREGMTPEQHEKYLLQNGGKFGTRRPVKSEQMSLYRWALCSPDRELLCLKSLTDFLYPKDKNDSIYWTIIRNPIGRGLAIPEPIIKKLYRD